MGLKSLGYTLLLMAEYDNKSCGVCQPQRWDVQGTVHTSFVALNPGTVSDKNLEGFKATSFGLPVYIYGFWTSYLHEAAFEKVQTSCWS